MILLKVSEYLITHLHIYFKKYIRNYIFQKFVQLSVRVGFDIGFRYNTLRTVQVYMPNLIDYETLIFGSIPSQFFWIQIFLTNYVR